jgi:ABC-type branched-subunit amino acid transport system ATPase component
VRNCKVNSHSRLLVESVDKHFDALHAVNDASLRVPARAIHGLIGPNGAGKTSLFNILSGFLAADAGRVTFAGTSLLELRPRDRASASPGRFRTSPYSDSSRVSTT